MIVRINKRHAELIVPERITSGSVGMTVSLEFSNEWAGLAKTAVFTDLGANSYDVLESSWDGNVVQIPHELMQTAGNPVWLGVYGCETNEDDDVVLAIPTVYCKLGTVKQGADPSGDESTDPTLAVWAQLQQDVDDVEDAIANEAIARANADSTETQNRRSADLALSTQIASKQDKLIAGSGITIAEDGKTISSTGGGGGGSTAWADITGKPSTFPPSYHTHSYNDLTNKPTIPAAVTDDHIAAVAATVVPSDDITANTDARHTHTNKTVLDGITAAKVAAWDACVADYQAALGVI